MSSSPRERRPDGRWDAAALALLAGTSALTALLYERLPAQVPVHFDLFGRADGYAHRSMGAWLLPAVTLLVWAFVRFGARLVPHGARERMEASPMALVGFLTTALMSAMQCIILWAALHPTDSMGRPLALSLGAYWLVLALVMPRVRRNPFVGVRTAWTLASDENWARTHRFSSFAFALGGLVAVLAALAQAPAFAIVAILVSAFAPLVFSFVVAHRLPPT